MTEELLTTAINKEIEARDFYNRISENVAKPKVKKMTAKISREEDRHRSALSSLFKRLFDKEFAPGDFERNPKLKIAEAVARDVKTAQEIVSVAIGMEDEAMEFYAEQAERTDDEDENYKTWMNILNAMLLGFKNMSSEEFLRSKHWEQNQESLRLFGIFGMSLWD